jgi:hypothetical protein
MNLGELRIFRSLLKNPGQMYVNADATEIYVIKDNGLLCFTGNFKQMSDAELNLQIQRHLAA